MTQPTPFNRSFSFTNFQAVNPTTPLPGNSLDVELNNVKTTSDQILASLVHLQNDDGSVANGSIGLNQLSPAVVSGFASPTVWATGIGYVSSPASVVFQGSGFYVCLISHTSGVFATDLAAGNWQLIVNLASVPLVAASQIAVTPSGSLTTNVQSSLQALDSGKAATSHTHVASAISDSTAAGRAILTAANVAAQQVLLGLGTLAFLNTVPVTNITANLALTGKIAPAALVSNTNDWAPTNWSTSAVVEVSASNPINITGFVATTDGDFKILDNVGTSEITLTAQDTSSAAANRILMPRPFGLKPNQSAVLKYDGTAANWRLQSPTTAHPVAGGFKNLVCGNVAGPNGFTAPTTANSQFKITCDAVELEDGNGEVWRVRNVSVVGDITVSGAANGFDGTGSLVSAPLFAWIIGSPLTNTVAALISRSATAPTMPSGYTFKARCAGTFTDAFSHFLRTLQHGRDARYVVVAATNTVALPLLVSGVNGSTFSTSAPTWSTPSVVGFVPTTASIIHLVASDNFNNAGAAEIGVAPSSAYGGPASANPPQYASNGTASSVNTPVSIGLEGSTIAWMSSAAGGALSVYMWTDNI